MATVNIRGIPVSFPFEPYAIQKDYMEKVIETLQNETNAVLESPTGTGKTLSLLCSSLAWLVQKKAQYQANAHNLDMFKMQDERFNKKTGSAVPKFAWDVPKIIYSSRTHSQLIQAMQELKRTTYSHMKASIIGSRDQMCIHPQVSQETNSSNKIHMCHALVKSRSCHFQNRVERMSTSPELNQSSVVDIEDLVKLGQKNTFCPYYMSKELQKHADIIFLPYNYLLDPKARRAQQLDFKNSIVILDEAHNVEKTCEDSASFQIKNTDIALCIEEVTTVMKKMEENASFTSGEDMDFTPEDLMLLKTMLLSLEKEIDNIPINNTKEGSTYDGKYIFEIFGNAGINDESQGPVIALLDKLIQFLSTSQENAFQRTGNGLQLLQDLMLIVFQRTSDEFKKKINDCYKVHIVIEEKDVKKKQVDTWLSKASSSTSKQSCRVLSYWCFSPGFGMGMLLEQGVRSVILTSGTLAPLRPLISELGIKIDVKLENPHVVSKNQICIKIISGGPDGVPLNSSYQNRDNEQYIASLGMTVTNIVRQVPHGVLIFFPSYPVMLKCQTEWQKSEVWTNLNQIKNVYVEPKTKDAFNSCMKEYYDKVKDPKIQGAIFMAVCRGKVSEGLDFADINGRCVIITGLPFPPLKDPRVVLKRQYLDILNAKDKEYLNGSSWYSLEATRAVNQAIGRVIRHKNDYGAILLLDSRFNNPQLKSQMSLWLRDMITSVNKFGEFIRELRLFYNEAQKNYPYVEKFSAPIPHKENFSYRKSESKKYFNSDASTSGEVKIHNDYNAEKKRKKINVKPIQVQYINNSETPKIGNANQKNMLEYIQSIRQVLSKEDYKIFSRAISTYRDNKDLDILIESLNNIFVSKKQERNMLYGLKPYLKVTHRDQYDKYCDRMNYY